MAGLIGFRTLPLRLSSSLLLTPSSSLLSPPQPTPFPSLSSSSSLLPSQNPSPLPPTTIRGYFVPNSLSTHEKKKENLQYPKLEQEVNDFLEESSKKQGASEDELALLGNIRADGARMQLSHFLGAAQNFIVDCDQIPFYSSLWYRQGLTAALSIRKPEDQGRLAPKFLEYYTKYKEEAENDRRAMLSLFQLLCRSGTFFADEATEVYHSLKTIHGNLPHSITILMLQLASKQDASIFTELLRDFQMIPQKDISNLSNPAHEVVQRLLFRHLDIEQMRAPAQEEPALLNELEKSIVYYVQSPRVQDSLEFSSLFPLLNLFMESNNWHGVRACLNCMGGIEEQLPHSVVSKLLQMSAQNEDVPRSLLLFAVLYEKKKLRKKDLHSLLFCLAKKKKVPLLLKILAFIGEDPNISMRNRTLTHETLFHIVHTLAPTAAKVDALAMYVKSVQDNPSLLFGGGDDSDVETEKTTKATIQTAGLEQGLFSDEFWATSDVKFGENSSQLLWNLAIEGGCILKDLDRSYTVFQEMLAAGVKPNETTFRALLFSVNIAKEPDSLPYIVEEMRKHIEFTETLYYNVLASTTVGDHQSLAESLLDQALNDPNIQPTLNMFKPMVLMYVRQGNVEKLKALFVIMQEKNLTPVYLLGYLPKSAIDILKKYLPKEPHRLADKKKRPNEKSE